MATAVYRDRTPGQKRCATHIVSPTSKRHLGTARHDLDLVEGGLSKAITEPNLIRASKHRTSWTKCWVRKLERTFFMYQEHSDRFLMSAIKLDDNTFLISQYDNFPELHVVGKPNSQQVPHGRYCAILKGDPGKPRFRLYSLECENCDGRLGRYSCDPVEDAAAKRGSPAKVGEGADVERQLLLDITQSVLFLERAGVNARRMHVQIPSLYSDFSRVVWCPRCPRGTFSGRSPFTRLPDAIGEAPPTKTYGASATTASAGAGGENGENVGSMNSRPHEALVADAKSLAAPYLGTLEAPALRRAASVGAETPSMTESLELTNRLPKWSEEIGSLTMKFLGSRVADSSSKNFLFEIPDPEGKGRRPVLQFGKLSTATFSVDFRSPISPIQAFGLFLSANAWAIKSK